MSFTFRPLALPEDEELLRNLLLAGFPELRDGPGATPEHLRWKYGASAEAGLSLLGFDGERPVAFYGVVPLQYDIGGTAHTIGLVVDVMSHPDVRRGGSSSRPARQRWSGSRAPRWRS